MRLAAAKSSAVLALMIARYWSSLVSTRRCAESWLTSPSAITAEAWLRILSTFSDPSSTISSNERAKRKSPTSTEALLPQMIFAVLRPRRRSDPSTTSSWSRVAVWMNSTAAASLQWRGPEEHTSETQSLMRTTVGAFCLKRKRTQQVYKHH